MSQQISNQNQENNVDNNGSTAPLKIEHQQLQSPHLPYLSKYIGDVFHPSSIFIPSNCHLTLDHYLKIKMKLKTKDTLQQIQRKKAAFIAYISANQPEIQCAPIKIEFEESHKNRPNRLKQQFSEFTFYKHSKQNMLYFIRICPSRPYKCSISVVNIIGEIIKYYPNIFSSKKQGKIMKFISQNKASLIIIYDYTQIEQTAKTFPSLINQARLLYYKIIDIHIRIPEALNMLTEKIEQSNKGRLQYINKDIILKTKQIQMLIDNGQFSHIIKKIEQIKRHQQTFLEEFRGVKTDNDCNLTFDMMSVNIWRQFRCVGKDIVHKILQLFNEKENELDQMIVKDTQVLHTPKRLQVSQNCSLCLSKSIQVKRPRRTFWICTSCSAEKERPIYLCKGCFKNYHTNNDVYLYRKNQKKTKKFRKSALRLIQKIKKNAPKINIKQQQQKIEEQRMTDNDKNLMELDKKCDQYFSKLDELIDEKHFSSAEFYLQMLMNTTLVKTHQFINKLDLKQSRAIKIEEI